MTTLVDVKAAAIEMIKADGLINLSRAGLCEKVGIPVGSFSHITGYTFTEFIVLMSALDIAEPDNISVSKTRTNPFLRKRHILDAAVELSVTHGYFQVTREQVAEAAGVSSSLVSQYYSMSELREAIMETAVTREIPEIIAQGIINGNIVALAVSPALRAKAIKIMRG